MPLTPNFSPTQQIGFPLAVYLTDTSTGSDVTITSRRVYITDETGAYLVPSGTTTDYTVWALIDTTISITCLTKDTAVNIKVDWVNVSGAVVQTKTYLYPARLGNLQASIDLTRAMRSAPSILQDTNYLMSRYALRLFIDDSVEATEIGGSISLSQASLDKATFLTSNQTKFF